MVINVKVFELLKSNSTIRRIVKKIKIRYEYNQDYKQFTKYYMDSCNGHKQIEYKILFIAHSLEKGLTHKDLRPFGEKKIKDILDCLKKLDSISKQKSTAYSIGYSILIKWIDIYDINEWDKSSVYYEVSEYIKDSNDKLSKCEVGSFEYNENIFSKYKGFDYLDALQTRHSVRDFEAKKIEEEDLKTCIKAAISSPSACNRQMCKIYYIDSSSEKKELADSIMGLTGFNKESINLFLITYDVSAFLFYGERNQGYFNAGLFAMNFVNALHFKGIGSCFLQWGNKHSQEKRIKEQLGIPNDEKIVIAIAAGYYKNNTLVPKSHRKQLIELYKKV